MISAVMLGVGNVSPGEGIVKPCGEPKMHVPSRSITRRDPGPESSEGRKAPVFGQMDWLRPTNMDVCVSNGRYTGTRSMGGTRTAGRRIYWGLYSSTKRTEAAGIVSVGTHKDYGMGIVSCGSEATLPMGAVVFRNRLVVVAAVA